MKHLKKLFRTTIWLVVIVALVVVGLRWVQGMPDWQNGNREYGAAMQQQAVQRAEQVRQQAEQRAEQVRQQAEAIARQVEANVQHLQPPMMANRDLPTYNDHHQLQPLPPQPMFEAGYHGKQHKESGIGGVFMTLAMLIAGVLLWRSGGRKRRVIAGILLALVLLPLLMMAMSFIVPVIVLYLVWRYLRRKSGREQLAFVTPDREYTAHTADFLDEWEQKARRHMKNKEEE